MSNENMFDKDFEVSEKAFIKWNCKGCQKENREYAKDMFILANIATTTCYDCGKINVLDLKTLKHIK